jgi:hypothetical protein
MTFLPTQLPRLDELILGGCVGIMILLTLATALWAAPNNWDSMTYHLPRVYRWLQDRGVDFFPTNFAPQLHNPPWSGYAVLQMLALKGDDRLVNLVQWFSMCGSVVGVSLIAERLGAALRFQLFAAVFCASLPMGILQASSSNNCYVTAFWLVCFAYYLLRLHTAPSWEGVVAAGVSLGLALFTKPTAYVFAAPLTAWLLGAWLFQVRQPRACLAVQFAALLVIAMTINAPHYLRNYDLYGAVLGPGKEGETNEWDYRNSTYSSRALASNVLRNLGTELNTPKRSFNHLVEQQIIAWHRRMGISVNDSRTTWLDCTFTLGEPEPHSEDYSGNFPHLIVILLVGIGAIFCGGIWRDARIGGLACALLMGLLLFCFLFRWQPWHNRLHLPLFILASPLVAMGLRSRRPALAVTAAVILTAWAWPFLVKNQSRPLVGPGNVCKASRNEQYFKHNPSLQQPYREAARLLRQRGCGAVGVVGHINQYEYPLWVLLNRGRLGECRLEDVGVRNVSARAYGGGPFRPDGLVVLREERPPHLVVNGEAYHSIWSCEVLAVYLPDAAP